MQPDPAADVCLLLEGTYPYVQGGVSTWVDQIIRGLPELRFALFFIGARREQHPRVVYSLPDNVVSRAELYLQEPLLESESVTAPIPPELRANLFRLLRELLCINSESERVTAFWRLLALMDEDSARLSYACLCQDPAAWDLVQHVYRTVAPEESFIDFFWTARLFARLIWKLWRARPDVPVARVYHSVSAGYAGLLGALVARQRGVPFLLTEHGIYTKERIAEISQADWIYQEQADWVEDARGLGKLREIWIELFLFLGRMAYDTADRIITLYAGNALIQIEFGAEGRRIEVIPNGVEPENFDGLLAGRMNRSAGAFKAKTVGFIGRVVPIKDLKTLITAAGLVCQKLPEVQFLIAGPYSEDSEYFEECRKAVAWLQLEHKVKFLGMQRVSEILRRIDILVLTSISEGMPLVVLEAMAAGIPVVATDVGACRELLLGEAPEDKALGPSGKLTRILAPTETADALLDLLRDPALLHQMGLVGRRRVERYYDATRLFESYRRLYRHLLESDRADASRFVAESLCR